jgi:uncharacterized protein DUF6232
VASTGLSTFTNSFGEVYADRVRFNVKKGWFGGTVEEEFAMRHITSVRCETTRSLLWGIILVIIGVVVLSNGGGAALIGLIMAGIGVLLLIGSPSVTINTAGGERRTSVGSPLQRSEANEYSSAVRRALFPE